MGIHYYLNPGGVVMAFDFKKTGGNSRLLVSEKKAVKVTIANAA